MDSAQRSSSKCKKYLLKSYSYLGNIFNAIWNILLQFTSPSYPAIKFSSILEKIDVKSRKNVLKTGAILF